MVGCLGGRMARATRLALAGMRGAEKPGSQTYGTSCHLRVRRRLFFGLERRGTIRSDDGGPVVGGGTRARTGTTRSSGTGNSDRTLSSMASPIC